MRLRRSRKKRPRSRAHWKRRLPSSIRTRQRWLQAIGEPLETQYEASCSGPGDDGVWTYDGFTVYTYRENGVETIVDAE